MGGKIEDGEDKYTAVRRELFEETGLTEKEVEFGKGVWQGELVLLMSGIQTLIKQSFILAKTRKINVTLEHLTPEEKPVAKSLKWFSVNEIKNSKDIIYPVGLHEYLSDLINNGCPDKPIKIVLDKSPSYKEDI